MAIRATRASSRPSRAISRTAASRMRVRAFSGTRRTLSGARDERRAPASRAAPALAEPALKPAASDFVYVELDPVIVHAHGAVAVDALADEEVLR
jgi:hypothetical protein